MKTRLTGLLLIYLLCCGLSVTAQVKLSTVTLNAGGNFFQNETFKLSSNIGEMAFVHTIFLPEFIISNGVLQPIVKRSLPENEASDIPFLSIYPTLTSSHFVYLEARLKEQATGVLTMYNMNGQLISQRSINIPAGSFKEKIQLPLSQSGEYMIDVIVKSNEWIAPIRRLFKIQQL